MAKESKAPAGEQKIADQITALKKQIGDKEATATQKKQLADWRNELGKMRFVRIANKRVPKVLKGIIGIANLSGVGYVSTPEQQKAIIAALNQAVAGVEQKLAGVKKEETGFSLPQT